MPASVYHHNRIGDHLRIQKRTTPTKLTQNCNKMSIAIEYGTFEIRGNSYLDRLAEQVPNVQDGFSHVLWKRERATHLTMYHQVSTVILAKKAMVCSLLIPLSKTFVASRSSIAILRTSRRPSQYFAT